MSLNSAIQKEREASGGLPVARARTMEETISRSTAPENFNMLVLTIFGCAALLLAAIGIYGLMAYSVAQRFLSPRLPLMSAPLTDVPHDHDRR